MLKDSEYFENIKSILSHSGTINNLVLESLSNSTPLHIPQDGRSKYSRKGLVNWMILSKLLRIESVNKSVNGQWKQIIAAGKDVVYKIKNNPAINWRQLMLTHAQGRIKGIKQ